MNLSCTALEFGAGSSALGWLGSKVICTLSAPQGRGQLRIPTLAGPHLNHINNSNPNLADISINAISSS